MKITPSILAVALFAALFFTRCNPDCASLQNVQVYPKLFTGGENIMIDAEPRNALQNKKITINGETAQINGFDPDAGLSVRVPDKFSGSAIRLNIEDLDCTENLELNLNAVPSGYFSAVGTFSPPAPLDFVVPDLTGNIFPPSIDNAWVNPVEPRYGLWFTSQKDNGVSRPLLNEAGSFERATCKCDRDNKEVYAFNHISGVMDHTPGHNYIHIFIDRTPIGGQVEEFTGHFINISSTDYPEKLDNIPCGCGDPKPDPTPGPYYMILLTSVTTGRQIIAYQSIVQ